MTMVSSGQISLGGTATSGGLNRSVNVELGRSGTASINMNESAVRTLFGVPSGAISMSNGYGKSNWSAYSGTMNIGFFTNGFAGYYGYIPDTMGTLSPLSTTVGGGGGTITGVYTSQGGAPIFLSVSIINPGSYTGNLRLTVLGVNYTLPYQGGTGGDPAEYYWGIFSGGPNWNPNQGQNVSVAITRI